MNLMYLLVFALLFPGSGPLPAFEYVFPLPDTKYHKCETQIIIKPGGVIRNEDLTALRSTKIVGSQSGVHTFKIKAVDQGRTILLVPEQQFLHGETVHLEFYGKYKSRLDFEIESEESMSLRPIDWSNAEEFSGLEAERDPLSEFPEAIITQNGQTGSGLIYGSTTFNEYDIFILDNAGAPVFKQNVGFMTAQNFRYINDTLCVYASLTDQYYVGLDTGFQVIDTFRCVNGFSTDFHDFLMTESGNVILASFDQQVIDMSQIVSGGDPEAVVTGLVLQEIDPGDNLLFQWRSWDHFEITDALYNGSDSMDFTTDNFSYVHFNSIELDHDGNWIISSRQMSEVTKISRATGEIMWRLGGKNNQFTFVNDSLDGFNLQHDARTTPDGTLTIFDNGYHHSPRQTRVVEYLIDEIDMTATLVWEFHNPYGDITLVAGNAQRLENGNTFINWGKRTTTPIPQDFFLEVDGSGNHVFELAFVNPPQMGWIYRAYRLPFKGDSLSTSVPVFGQLRGHIRVYPNPVLSELQIQFKPEVTGAYKWAIYSIMGTRIADENFHLENIKEYSQTIQLKGVPAGGYFIQIENETGEVLSERFLKMD